MDATHLNNCKIFYYNINDKNVYYDLGELINLPNTSSTQPHITTHKNQKALYFASNRPGGKGGLDIWVSVMGRKGNFWITNKLRRKNKFICRRCNPLL